jgi:hypothetical protein
MIFKNRSIGKQVTIDLDTYFYFFVRPLDEVPEGEKQGVTLNSVRERLQRMICRIPPGYAMNLDVHYRRSSKDHVHVRIRFMQDLDVLDGFMIRAWMLDDQTRLELDLARYLLTDDLNEMNRCFDEKAEHDGIKKAGPWIPLTCDRDHFPGDAFKDWNDYLPRWNRLLETLAQKIQKKTDEQRNLDVT